MKQFEQGMIIKWQVSVIIIYSYYFKKGQVIASMAFSITLQPEAFFSRIVCTYYGYTVKFEKIEIKIYDP